MMEPVRDLMAEARERRAREPWVFNWYGALWSWVLAGVVGAWGAMGIEGAIRTLNDPAFWRSVGETIDWAAWWVVENVSPTAAAGAVVGILFVSWMMWLDMKDDRR